MPRPLPSQDTLQILLNYDPETGALTWRARALEMFEEEWHQRKWNTRYAGTEALCSLHSNGYLYGNLLNQKVRAHRVIWKLVHNVGADDVDHGDGDRRNNRLLNLRDSTRSQNMRNSKRHKDNIRGALGVTWDKARAKWKVHILKKNVGRYDCFGQALAARKQAESGMGFHANHGRLQ